MRSLQRPAYHHIDEKAMNTRMRVSAVRLLLASIAVTACHHRAAAPGESVLPSGVAVVADASATRDSVGQLVRGMRDAAAKGSWATIAHLFPDSGQMRRMAEYFVIGQARHADLLSFWRQDARVAFDRMTLHSIGADTVSVAIPFRVGGSTGGWVGIFARRASGGWQLVCTQERYPTPPTGPCQVHRTSD
jgi:hypothetical protein